jgi:hypothetical protein
MLRKALPDLIEVCASCQHASLLHSLMSPVCFGQREKVCVAGFQLL